MSIIPEGNVKRWFDEIGKYYEMDEETAYWLQRGANELTGFASRIEHILDDVYHDSDSDETNLYNDLSETDDEKEVALKMIAQDVRKAIYNQGRRGR